MGTFPFSAIVGQQEMKIALLIAAVDARVGGVMIFGDRGTGKSTAARALAAALPPIPVVDGCRFHCAPDARDACPDPCTSGRTRKMAVPFVDLPLGATEDRVLGTLDLERALAHGEKHFDPVCWPRRIAAFSMSMRSTCWKITSSTCCLMSPPKIRIWEREFSHGL